MRRAWLWRVERGFEMDRVDKVEDKGESRKGSGEHECIHYLDVTNKVVVKKAVRISEC